MTVKEKDGENDSASKLDREHTHRVNLGVRKDTFQGLFGPGLKRPCKGGIVDMAYDFASIDQTLPHPVYAWMGRICCLNPSEKTVEILKPYMREAYEYAKEKYEKRQI